MESQQKKVLIMGASSGIGRELALMYAEKGCVVGVAGRKMRLLEEIRKVYPDRILTKRINVCYHKTASQRMHRLIKEMGGLDLYIHSSGIGKQNPLLHFSLDRDIIETNVEGFSRMIASIYQYCCKQGYGHIAAITSIAGIRGLRFAPSYSASKAYQHTYLEALRAKSKKERAGVCITEVVPGFVRTAMCNDKKAFWVASAQKAARQIVQALERKKELVYVTRRWRIVALVLKYMPTNIFIRI